MSTEPNPTPPDQSPAEDAPSEAPAAAASQTEKSESTEAAAKRKIRIGSQRSTTPVSASKPVPPPLDLRPRTPREEPKLPEVANVESEAVVEKEVAKPQAAGEAETQASKSEPSFSELASEQSPDIAASVAKLLAKKEELAASEAPVEEDTSDLPQVEFKQPTEVDLEKEIEAALGNMSLDDLLADQEQITDKAGQQLETEDRVPGTVMKVDREYVFFALGSRNQGISGLKHFKEVPEIGTVMDVVVQKFDADEGLYEVSVPGASVDVADWSDVSEGVVVEARVTGHNAGGLECEVSHIRGFIPMSQIAVHRVDNAEDYVGQKLSCVVTEANAGRGNLVLSHRAILERDQEANLEKLFAELEVGQVHKATVRKLMDFGAFAEIAPGVDGLIHISQLSWDRVNHPSDVLTEGEKIEVRIEKIDEATRKIGLSYRELQDNPWNNVNKKYFPGSVVKGTVSRIAQFGAFVKLEPGVEGLVHISEVAHHRVHRVNTEVDEGQEVEVKILEVDEEKQRISLSMKATVQPPVEEAKPDDAKSQAAEEPDEPPRELAVPARKGPLKGGTKRKKTGGEGVGLQW